MKMLAYWVEVTKMMLAYVNQHTDGNLKNSSANLPF